MLGHISNASTWQAVRVQPALPSKYQTRQEQTNQKDLGCNSLLERSPSTKSCVQASGLGGKQKITKRKAMSWVPAVKPELTRLWKEKNTKLELKLCLDGVCQTPLGCGDARL